MILAVTGALGFLGHHFVDAALAKGHRCWIVDAETYAADLSHLDRWEALNVHYEQADIVVLTHLPDVDAVIHFAAETHVDNSILDASFFVRTNIAGTHRLLELVRGKRNYTAPHFIQISTDEVYGSVPRGKTPESASLHPSSPYAASKAGADLLVQSYGITHHLGYNIVRPSNCYGSGQYPEKLIPKAVRYFTLGKQMPVHDTGEHRRSWLDVNDCAQAILTVLDRGESGATYNVGGNTEASVMQIVKTVAAHFEKPRIQIANQRPGVDYRYAVDDTALRALGWSPAGDLWRDLPQLIETERHAWRW